jgi:hypothetical protein
MSTLASEIAEYLAWIDAELAVQDAQTAGPWNTQTYSYRVQTNEGGVGKFVAEMMTNTSCERDADATGIAHARNGYAITLRAMRRAVEGLVGAIASDAIAVKALQTQFGNYDPDPSQLEATLRDILETWKASQPL